MNAPRFDRLLAVGRPPAERIFKLPGRRIVTALSLFLLFLTGGCTHLHSDTNEKTARNASETLQKLNVAGINTTARVNLAKLDNAEIEAAANFNDVRLRQDLLHVLNPSPSDLVDGSSNARVGWPKLKRERDAFLESLDVNDDDAYTKICQREGARQHLQADIIDLKKEEKQTKRIILGIDGSVDIPTRLKDCQIILGGINDENQCNSKKGDVDKQICHLCWRQTEIKKKEAELTIRNQKIALENELSNSKEEAESLKSAYDEAKKAYDKAVKRLAKMEKDDKESASEGAEGSVDGNQTEEQKIAEKKEATDQLASASDKIAKALEAAKKFPLVESELQGDFLSGMIVDINFLAGAEDDATQDGASSQAKNVQALWKVAQRTSDRFAKVDRPNVNSLRLELALHRLRYERLSTLMKARQEELTIHEGHLQLIEREAALWIQIARATDNRYRGINCGKNLIDPDALSTRDLNRLNRGVPVITFFEEQKNNVASGREKRRAIARILLAYAAAKEAHRAQDLMRIRAIQLNQSVAVGMSEISVSAWNDLLAAPVAELLQYHEGGVTTQEIANLINALGLGAIAWGVN